MRRDDGEIAALDDEQQVAHRRLVGGDGVQIGRRARAPPCRAGRARRARRRGGSRSG